MKYRFLLPVLLLATFGMTAVQAEAPFLDPASDPEHFGPPDKILFWTPEQQVAGYRNMDKILPTRLVRADGTASTLPEALVELGNVAVRTKNNEMKTSHVQKNSPKLISNGELNPSAACVSAAPCSCNTARSVYSI